MKQLPNYLPLKALLALALAAGGNLAAAPATTAATAPTAAATPAAPSAIFARVGDAVITQDDFNTAFNAAARAKFYHGKPPDQDIAVLQREVSDQLVARVLLQREARQRGLRPDDAEIQKTVTTYEKRYAGSEQWKKNKAQMLPPLVHRLEQDSLVSQIEKNVRAAAKPSDKEVKAFYTGHRELFTEPEQLRVSVILLKVDPSAPPAAWKAAHDQGQALAKRARAGEDFAALARKHSTDDSAKLGGDMGYLHLGMLPDGTQDALAKLKPGEIADSMRLLQGQAVFRLTERKPAKLREFDAVKERAQELAQREQSDRVWKAFIAGLKTKTPVKVDQSHFLPLAAKSDARTAPK